MASSTSTVQLIVNGKRLDGRSVDDLRKLRIEAGVLNEADGSSLVEWGGNKIVCGIYGPRECIPKHESNPYRAKIKCRYSMSPFASKEEHGRSGPSRRSQELSKVIGEVFENLIIAEAYPKTQIDIYIDVLQAEGGTRIAAVAAAAVALANAGIPMKDMAGGVAVGKAGGEIVVDLGKEEDNLGQSDMPIVFAHRTKEILLLQMDGMLTKKELEKALDLAEKGAEKVHTLQADALKRNYETVKDEVKLDL
jgi:exosome complex component RRP41